MPLFALQVCNDAFVCGFLITAEQLADCFIAGDSNQYKVDYSKLEALGELMILLLVVSLQLPQCSPTATYCTRLDNHAADGNQLHVS